MCCNFNTGCQGVLPNDTSKAFLSWFHDENMLIWPLCIFPWVSNELLLNCIWVEWEASVFVQSYWTPLKEKQLINLSQLWVQNHITGIQLWTFLLSKKCFLWDWKPAAVRELSSWTKYRTKALRTLMCNSYFVFEL